MLNENEVCGVCIHGFECGVFLWVYSFNVYSSSSSPTGTGTTPTPIPLALPDDDDKSGPDNFKNDVTIFPDPPDAIGTPASFKSAVSLESLSSSLTTGMPLLPPNPPLKPPKPPADVLLNAPNFDVMAAIFGEMTACKSCCNELIGTGGSMPAALFFATFAASN